MLHGWLRGVVECLLVIGRQDLLFLTDCQILSGYCSNISLKKSLKFAFEALFKNSGNRTRTYLIFVLRI